MKRCQTRKVQNPHDPTPKTEAKTWKALPYPQKERAVNICDGLLSGRTYRSLGGRKLARRPEIVRFSLGKRYRLICERQSKQTIPLMILSHERYNKFHKNI